MNRPPKLLAISSPGGHWIQLTRLCQGLESRYTLVYALPSALFGAPKMADGQKVYSVLDVSADDKWRLVPCALQVLYILLKERPRAILSTGAAPGAIAIWLGSLLGVRTIWVDSIANVKQLSRAGRLAQKRADVFLTQWEHLSNGQTILYKGAVL
ncbi:oligosaccharide biosynthesis protein Alg14 [Candidatus Thiothrix sp. Deng01]|uniref:Oligosaccharide biosynthesis protein Alg14 n=1 Tax=Candidatus Thiothrix phosphatis TaxID=3112415 RepID=A0ABU6CRU6_9GAMM|nr:oligosaccharide biosynthesis protein Alg14 [Candidatus Thiothrix sp. Deng01]MEB4589558.1 oligosaccharide biosynthesis protein Alg14 [Candidatus Thiothrix sp. Deng01]